jgi:hypothetical protein
VGGSESDGVPVRWTAAVMPSVVRDHSKSVVVCDDSSWKISRSPSDEVETRLPLDA